MPAPLRVIVPFLFRFFLVLSFLFPLQMLPAQTIRGRITDDTGNPIAYASIFVRELKQGTSSNTDGYYALNLPLGEYTFTFRSLGYETVDMKVRVAFGESSLNITLPVKPFLIAPVTIGGKGEDIAYDVVRKAIAMAPYYSNLVGEYEAEVYLKGTIKIDKLSWLVKRSLKGTDNPPREGASYLQETFNNIKFKAPDRYEQNVKMIRSNFPGELNNTSNILGFVSANLYQPKLGEIILPLSPYAFNHYNFKYEGYTFQDNRALVKVRVIPKRKSRQLVEGHMYIAEDYWNIHEVDFMVQSLAGPLKVKQTFGEVETNIWLPISQFFSIVANFLGNQGKIKYVTSVRYKNVKVNTAVRPTLKLNEPLAQKSTPAAATIEPVKQSKKQQRRKQRMEQLLAKDNLSNREMYELQKFVEKQVIKSDTAKSLEVPPPLIIVIDTLATKADTLAWSQIRPVALTGDELKLRKEIDQKLSTVNDSTATDSVAKRNVFMTIASGHRWVLGKGKETIRFSGIFAPNEFRFNTVDGFVLGGWVSYRRQFSHNAITLRQSVYYAFARKTPMGEFDFRTSYANMNRGLLIFNAGWISTDFNSQNGISSITNTSASLWFGRNYMKLYENRYISLTNRIDPFNGFEITTTAGFSKRVELSNNTNFIIYAQNQKWYTPNIPVNYEAITERLVTHTALYAILRIKYTPYYHYRVRNNRKQMLFSRWPTFSITLKKAFTELFSTDANYMAWEAIVNQSIRTGPSNRIDYKIIYGDFPQTSKLYFADFKHFNTQDVPVVIPSFLEGYQNLSYYRYSTSGRYGQAFIGYQSSYLALKYLPFLSNRIWLENIRIAVLKLSGRKPCYEAGYYLSQIGAIGGIGVFASFKGSRFSSFSVKVSLFLPGTD